MPKKIPPHLPAPVCHVPSHRRWERLKVILAAAGFGLLAGITGASITLGWIWPGYGGGDLWAFTQSRSAISKIQLEDKINQEIRDRIFSVYGSSAAVGQDSYSLRQQDKLGDAIVISSDGWMAMYLPAGSVSYKNWRVVARDGAVYTVEKMLADRFSGVSYFKVATRTVTGQNVAQFKVATFDESINFSQEIFVFSRDNWHRNLISYPVPATNPVSHLDTAPSYFYGLDSAAESGAVVINNQGRVVGFINRSGLLIPNVYVTRIVPSLLSDLKITYLSLGVEGLFNREQPIVSFGERKSGFMVSRVLAKNSLLKKGDIIQEINGREIERDDILWYNKDQTVRVKLLRVGKTVEVEAPVVEIN